MHLFPLADPGISKRGGGDCPGAVELSGSWDCFDVPSYTYSMFFWSEIREWNTYRKVCACYAVEIYKNNPTIFLKQWLKGF